jgi:hypothetical protein
MAHVLIAKLYLALPDLSWPLIEVLAQLKSPIQSRMMFLDLYEANFDKLQLIMDVSFWPRRASRETLHSHHVFFDFESVDAVHTECHQ